MRLSQIVESIDRALDGGTLREPFSNEEFRASCPGFGRGTYNAFLWKHRKGNPDRKTEYFEKVGINKFRRIRGI